MADTLPENPYWQWVTTTESLLAIRDRRLYRETHPDFHAYLRDHWSLTPEQAREAERKADDPSLQARAYTLGQIWNLVPGINLMPHDGIGLDLDSIPKDLSFETWKKMLDLFMFLAGGSHGLERQARGR